MKLDPGQIAIVFSPIRDDKDDSWTGSIHTGLLFGVEKDPEAMAHAMDMAITFAATQNFLEDNPEFLDEYDYYKEKILEEMFPEQYAATMSEIEEETSYSKQDNVIRLNRWTKTQGNA